MIKIDVYPAVPLDTGLRKKGKRVYLSPERRLKVIKATEGSVTVKPYGRGNYQSIDVNPMFLELITQNGKRVNLCSATCPIWLICEA